MLWRISNAARAREAAEEIEGLGRRAIVVQTDVADQDQAQAMVQRAIETFGRIDILVNNAGNAVLTPLLETTAATWDRTLKIHLYGTFSVPRPWYATWCRKGADAL